MGEQIKANSQQLKGLAAFLEGLTDLSVQTGIAVTGTVSLSADGMSVGISRDDATGQYVFDDLVGA